MTRLRKFLQLTSNDRRLLLYSWKLMMMVRFLMYFIRFERLKTFVDRRSGKNSSNPVPLEKLVWAVQVVSRYVPQSTCLCQSLTMTILLRRNSYPSKLVFGVAKENGGKLEAHAWVESNGRIVVGNTELSRFTVLSSFD